MPVTAEQVQILYEISMSIGTSLELRKMVKTALSAYLKKLNCFVGSVLQLTEDKTGKLKYKKVYSIPRNVETIDAYNEAINTFILSGEESYNKNFSELLPYSYTHSSGQHCYIMNLPGFGILFLATGGKQFDDYIINSIHQLNSKFANACLACVQNEALHISEEKYRCIFNSIQDVYAEVNVASGTILEITPSIKRVSGYSREEMIGQDISRFYAHPGQRMQLIQILSKQGTVNDYEVEMVSKSGQTRTLSFSVSLVKGQDAESAKIVGTMRDITARKETEQFIKSNKKRLDLALQGGQLGLWDWDIKTGTVHINDIYSTMLGYDDEEWKPDINTLNDLVHPESLSLVKEKLDKHLAGETEFFRSEHRVRTKQGTWIWVATRGQVVERDENGNALRMVGTQKDITESKNIFEELNENKKRLQTIFDSLPVGLVVVDPVKRRIIQSNPAAEKLLGRDGSELKKMDCLNTLCPEEGGETGCPAMKHKGTNYHQHECTLISADNLRIPIIKTAVQVTLAGRQVILESLMDITKLKEAEQALKEAIRMKSDFVSNVSHELRTPMASIMGFAGTILRDKNLDNETQLEFTRIIYEESQRLSRLIENILDIARIESGKINFKKQMAKLNLLIEEVVQTQLVLAQKKQIKLVTHIDENIPEIMATPDAIKQMALNLISNAIKFTDPGGKVELSLTANDGRIIFIVKDTGLGIPKDDLQKIFDKFYRVSRAKREDQGTGLGLAIVREIIDRHNGKIDVESEPGKGTTFKVSLPVTET